MSVLETRGLGKQYSGRRVVDDVSLEVRSGEIVGLLGPNGAGKTTCFYMIVGLVPVDRGRILFDGRDITRLPMHQRARLGVGYLPQEPSVFRHLTAADNIRAILETRADLNRAQREAALEELLRDLQIAERRDSLGVSLSGGERARDLEAPASIPFPSSRSRA
jgi:lipopolysaccharide export system ATP-binding protein